MCRHVVWQCQENPFPPKILAKTYKGKAVTSTIIASQAMTSVGDDDDGVTILKIGGSSITNKAREETLNEGALDWFANLIYASVDASFLAPGRDSKRGGERGGDDEDDVTECNVSKRTGGGRRFVVVHGAGSFGHHSAKRHGLRCGKAAFLEDGAIVDSALPPLPPPPPRDDAADPDEPPPTREGGAATEEERRRYQMEGLSRTRRSVQKLNAATVDRLIECGVNAVGISPGMAVRGLRAHGATTRPTVRRRGAPSPSSSSDSAARDDDDDDDDDDGDGSPRAMRALCESVKEALRAGLVPVVHGDACLLYDGVRAGILGGDTIAEGLATMWNEGGTTTISEGSRISRVIFITDVAGVYTSDPKSNVDAELIRCIRVDGDNGALSIERECDGDDDDDDNDGKRGRSEADGMNVTGSSHAHDVTGGLKVRPFFSPNSSLGRFSMFVSSFRP